MRAHVKATPKVQEYYQGCQQKQLSAISKRATMTETELKKKKTAKKNKNKKKQENKTKQEPTNKPKENEIDDDKIQARTIAPAYASTYSRTRECH